MHNIYTLYIHELRQRNSTGHTLESHSAIFRNGMVLCWFVLLRLNLSLLSPELLLCASSHSHQVILVPTENSFFVFFSCTHQHKTGMKSNNETYKPSTCLMLLLSHCNFIWWEKLWNALFGYVYTCQSVKSTALLWSHTYLGALISSIKLTDARKKSIPPIYYLSTNIHQHTNSVQSNVM